MSEKESIISAKKKTKENIKEIFFKESKNKIYWIIKLKNIDKLDELLNWLEILPCNFIIIWKDIKTQNIVWIESIDKLEELLYMWFDFVICDNSEKELKKFTSNWICPIINKNNMFKNYFSDFDAMSWRWNSFSYLDWNIWSIFYNISIYLENYKFPYDNKNLIKNILLTFK